MQRDGSDRWRAAGLAEPLAHLGMAGGAHATMHRLVTVLQEARRRLGIAAEIMVKHTTVVPKSGEHRKHTVKVKKCRYRPGWCS